MGKRFSVIGVLLSISLWASLVYCQNISEDEEKEIYKYMIHQQRLMCEGGGGNLKEIFNYTAEDYWITVDEAKRIYRSRFYRPKSAQEQKITNRMLEKFASFPQTATREDHVRVGKEIMEEFGIDEDDLFEIDIRNIPPGSSELKDLGIED